MRRQSVLRPPVPERRTVSVASGLAWIALLALLLWLLHHAGSGPLGGPPSWDRSGLREWLDGTDGVLAAFAILRLVGLGLGAYLLAVAVLGVLARLTQRRSLIRLADVATLPFARGLLGTAAGVGLTASTIGLVALDARLEAAPIGVSTAGPAPTESLRRLPDPADPSSPDAPDGTSTMRVEDGAAEAAPPEEGPPSEAGPPPEWTAEPGDHFWSIAADTLAQGWGRTPTDGEVVPYWTAVMEANRDRLVDPGNPELIYPGQVFRLPDLPPA